MQDLVNFVYVSLLFCKKGEGKIGSRSWFNNMRQQREKKSKLH